MTIYLMLACLALLAGGLVALMAYANSYVPPEAPEYPDLRVLPCDPHARQPRAARQEDPEEWWYIDS